MKSSPEDYTEHNFEMNIYESHKIHLRYFEVKMINRKLAFFYIMLAIFLFSIGLGCTTKLPTQQPTDTTTQRPTETPNSQPTETPNSQLNMTIASPVDGNTVSVSEPVYGNLTGVYGSNSHLYVLINPVETGNLWWVQPEASVSPDGSWHVNVFFGRDNKEDAGKKYWVSAIVTSDKLPEGPQASYPSNVICRINKDILVTRT